MAKTSVDKLVPVAGLDLTGAAGATLGTATHVEVSVFYTKGGTSYFTGRDEARGYWASAKPVEASDGVKRFMLFDKNGFKVFLRPAARFSAKTLTDLSDTVLRHADAVAAAVAAGDKGKAADLLLAHKGA